MTAATAAEWFVGADLPPASSRRPQMQGLCWIDRVVTTDDGVDLAVRDYPSATGVPIHTVVLLHGFCLSQVTWSIQIRMLRRAWPDVRVISLDYRGHGQSASAPIATYTLEQVADDIGHVLSVLDVGGPVTMGCHSMGGMVALTYLSLAPQRRPVLPTGLVLVATAAGKLVERGIGRLLATPALGALGAVVDHAPPRAADHAIRALIRPVCQGFSRMAGLGDAQRAALAAAATAALQRTPLATAVGFLPSLKGYDCYDSLPQVAARTVVVSGGADAVTPSAHSDDLAANIPGAVRLHDPRGGHMLLYAAPRLVFDAITHTLSPTPICVEVRPKVLETL